MKKIFRAWKNGRLINNAIPYSRNQVVVGARLLNGTPTLKIDDVDCVEQKFDIYPFNSQDGVFEGDVVSYYDQWEHTIYLSVVEESSIEDHEEVSWNCEALRCEQKLKKLDENSEEHNYEDILYDGLLLGNIHSDPDLKDDYWKTKYQQEFEKAKEEYDK